MVGTEGIIKGGGDRGELVRGDSSSVEHDEVNDRVTALVGVRSPSRGVRFRDDLEVVVRYPILD
jgi:hypothetical protein